MAKTTKNKKEQEQNPVVETVSPSEVRQVAAIDIGTSSIRLALAEIDPDGRIRRLETLSQNVSIGRDTFTNGQILPETVEECVRILTRFKRVMEEYLVTQPDQIRAVATSAVREAENRDLFLDRIFMATNITVEAIDAAETTRLTYLGVQPYLNSDSKLAKGNNLIVEVGGGSTEILQVSGGNIASSHVYDFGPLRYNTEGNELDRFAQENLAHQIALLTESAKEQVKERQNLRLICLGGDARFAARQIKPGWDAQKPAKISTTLLAALTEELAGLSPDELVESYHITYPEAETLAPALAAYTELAKAFNLKQILVSGITMRDGLLMEMVQRDAWFQQFNQQIIRSVIEFGERYQVNQLHALEVSSLATWLFDQLQDEHRLAPRYRLVIEIAALLHETGRFISERGFHKHTQYLIQHSDIFGLGNSMTELVALVARYHRKAGPSLRHPAFAAVDRESRFAVNQLAAMLRIADALGQSRRQQISDVVCERPEGQLVLLISGIEDLSLEQLALQDKGSLFQDVFGREVIFRKRAISSRK